MAASRVLDRVGQVLGGRYRLVAPVGTGASASVYLADDVNLHRRVAVKVLHDALADDEAFLRRFRAEARAAAALNHPNILAVHDWGEDDGVPFLVTEFLAGGSLRAMLDLGRLLSPAQALLVGLETARGLEYAHRRGLVHRDIKPANLIFDDEGRLRIADFGLARALAEAAWTEPMGAVLGTARYASPEQARGERLDGRSDVYSLALVVIEAVTGSVPFQADTTIGTLMARVDAPVPVPEALGPLRPVLEAVGTPDPSLRPDAAEFGNALLQAARAFDRPAPLPLAGTRLLGELVEDPDPTEPVPTGAAAPVGAESAQNLRRSVDEDRVPAGEAGPGWSPVPDREPADEADDEATVVVPAWHTAGGDAGADEDADASDIPPTRRAWRADKQLAKASARAEAARRKAADRAARGRRRWPRVLAVVLVVLALAAGGAAAWWYLVRVPTWAVPTLVGQDAGALGAIPADHQWTVQQRDEFADATPAGRILTQDPPPGTELVRGGTLRVTVSLGPPPVTVPVDLVGRPLEEATTALEAAGLVAGPAQQQFDEEVPAGIVLSLAPDTPTELPKGSAVSVVVSAGPEPRTIPDGLVGRPSDQVVTQLRGLGLAPEVAEEFSETVAKGIVLEVTPPAGQQVPKGGAVDVLVSKGPPTVTVPDVAGLSVVDAGTRLEAAGLVVSGTQGSPTRTVTGTTPAAGQVVRRGTSVTIVTG